LFGFYQIKLPARFEEKIANLSRHQKSGRYVSVAIMGCLATLIVSPCVTPALIGVLAYIGTSGNAKLGGIALFSMGFGMGIPLLLLGIAGGKLLPKAGAWMKTIEAVLGVMLLAVAIWILSRVIPGQVSMALWALLLIISAYFMGVFSANNGSGWKKLWRGFGFVFLVYGVLLIIGASKGNSNPLQPLASRCTYNSELTFTPVRTLADLDNALSKAKAEHRPVMVDFYADWCISCKEMAYTTFTNPAVKSTLQKFTVLQADVTRNDSNDKSLLNRFKVIAPPTFVFFDAHGNLLQQQTIVGKMDAPEFLKHLQQI
jgi:thiol:disulfide interchange protein DsbD